MSNEIAHNFTPNLTLYLCRFQLDGDVFLTSGASDEEWGAGGNDADDYDVTMTEKGNSGHYVGDFDTSENIAEGQYRVTVYLQTGAAPIDADLAIAQGVGTWDGAEFHFFADCATAAEVAAAHAVTDADIAASHVTTDALITSSHVTTDALIAALAVVERLVKNVYGPNEETAEGVTPENLTQ